MYTFLVHQKRSPDRARALIEALNTPTMDMTALLVALRSIFVGFILHRKILAAFMRLAGKMHSCAPESATAPSTFITTKPLDDGNVNATSMRGWSLGTPLYSQRIALVLSDAAEILAGGDKPEDESDWKAFAAAFIFLPPFLACFSAFRLDRQQSRHSSYGRLL